MKIQLDGSVLESERDVLSALREALFPDRGFGWNRSSLLDALSTDVDRPLTIEWLDSQRSCRVLGSSTFGELCALLGSVAAQDVEWGLQDRLEVCLR